MSQTGGKPELSIPCAETLQQACKLSIKHRNLCVFIFTLIPFKGNICIATNEDEKIIFKTNDEHTSPIQNTYKVNDEYCSYGKYYICNFC